MAKKRITRKIASIKPLFEDILVCNDKKSRPLIEIFIQEPENITQENLGTLLGVFEISDNTENSSYIANYLISILKKEYFSKPKRGAIESFEAALHKANLALSKLAEHGNVNWIGKLNAIVASIEKNNLHLTQTGTAVAFFIRSASMTDISDGLASEDIDTNPLKTFTNVTSGRLEKSDKIILSTNGILEIFSPEEIKKSALRFSEEKFIQFLKTALGNELEKAAVIIADISEKELPENPEIVPKNTAPINAFSKNTFSKACPSLPEKEIVQEMLHKEVAALSNEKNGHIYIKEETAIPSTSSLTQDYLAVAKEKSKVCLDATSSFLKPVFSFSWLRKISFSKINIPRPAIKLPSRALLTINIRGLWKKAMPLASYFFSIIKKILPDFKKITAILSKLDYQQRVYAVLIILTIMTAPLFAIKLRNNAKNTPSESSSETIPLSIPLENDKNVIRVENLNSMLLDNNIIKPVNLNGKIFAITATKIIDLEKNELFAIPENFSSPRFAVAMSDLNFIFLINAGNHIAYFSPASGKFYENEITIPSETRIVGVETYLTYLYIADAKNNQIYRYPRAEGGFGEKIVWTKEPIDLGSVSNIAIDEAVYLLGDNFLLKFFRGKKQEFNIEQSTTPVKFSKVFTDSDTTHIYTLDNLNGRIIKYGKNGELIAQYHNEKIKSALDLAVDEKNNSLYFSTSDSLISFSL